MKEEHRADIHQLLAYTSFSRNDNKLSFLCYPNIDVNYSELNYFSTMSQIRNKVILFGIPLSKSKITEIQSIIKTIITEYENTTSER